MNNSSPNIKTSKPIQQAFQKKDSFKLGGEISII